MRTEVYVSGEVAAVLDLYDGLVDERAWVRPVPAQLELLAQRLLGGHGEGHRGVAVERLSRDPGLRGASAEEALSRPLTVEGAREVVAREHGFGSWEEVAPAPADPETSRAFEAAVEALLAGDLGVLAEALDGEPDLVSRRSRYGHRSTLLHYLAANGVENYRQRVPLNAAAVASLLLERGADPEAKAEVYGGRHTTRELLVTSAHPAEAGVADDVLAVLEEAGR